MYVQGKAGLTDAFSSQVILCLLLLLKAVMGKKIHGALDMCAHIKGTEFLFFLKQDYYKKNYSFYQENKNPAYICSLQTPVNGTFPAATINGPRSQSGQIL